MSDAEKGVHGVGVHGVEVRGGATAEELAAVLAVVARPRRPDAVDPLTRWRRRRQAVTRPTRR